jgi:NAD(P)-dependent dehydrogenase (short-subunit alcohol dehydrogenase family)
VTWDVDGRTALITGGNSGIGFAAAAELARRGANVVLTSRDPIQGRSAADAIEADTGRPVTPMVLDLASFATVRSFAEGLAARVGRVDLLVNNAGCYVTPRRETVDGFEWTMAVNHLGPFLLTCLLAGDPATRPERIVNVASDMHRSARRDLAFTSLEPAGRYWGTGAYARSKLANVLFTRELAKRFSDCGTTALSVHPGNVATRITQDGDSRLAAFVWRAAASRMRTPAEGAATVVYAATEPSVAAHSGGYLADERLTTPSDAALMDGAAVRLWEMSAAATGCDCACIDAAPEDGMARA